MMNTVEYAPLGHQGDWLNGTKHPSSPWWLSLWRVVNVVMATFFFLAALVQVNDPDPYLWVPAYAVPCALAVAVTVRPDVTSFAWWRHLAVTHISLCLAGSLYLAIVVTELIVNDVKSPLVHEEGRELGGLLINIIWLGVCRFTTLGTPQPGKDSVSSLLLVAGVLALMPLAFWGLCFVEQLTHKLAHCHDMFNGGLFSRQAVVANSNI